MRPPAIIPAGFVPARLVMACLLAAGLAATLIPLRAPLARTAAEAPATAPTAAPLTAADVRRFAALCRETQAARAGREPSMDGARNVDLDALARKHGFAGEADAMEMAMRIAMTEMYAADPQAAEQMMAGPMDPEMKTVLARAVADAPAVKANADALKACKAG